MRRGEARRIAFGGMMAALAMTIMCVGGLIPIATFTCPVISMLILAYVTKLCGKRIGWAWYGAVSILGLILAPDKEAAAIFLAIGYYPILKPWLDRRKLKWLWKGLLFNAVTDALEEMEKMNFGRAKELLITAQQARAMRLSGQQPAPGAVLTPLAKEILERE